MSEESNQVQISIFGQEYSVKAPADPEYIKKIAEFKYFISKEITAGKIAGAEVLISKDNKIVLHEAQGFANITKQKKLAKNSIYYIQSMTRPMVPVGATTVVWALR